MIVSIAHGGALMPAMLWPFAIGDASMQSAGSGTALVSTD